MVGRRSYVMEGGSISCSKRALSHLPSGILLVGQDFARSQGGIVWPMIFLLFSLFRFCGGAFCRYCNLVLLRVGGVAGSRGSLRSSACSQQPESLSQIQN